MGSFVLITPCCTPRPIVMTKAAMLPICHSSVLPWRRICRLFMLCCRVSAEFMCHVGSIDPNTTLARHRKPEILEAAWPKAGLQILFKTRRHGRRLGFRVWWFRGLGSTFYGFRGLEFRVQG